MLLTHWPCGSLCLGTLPQKHNSLYEWRVLRRHQPVINMMSARNVPCPMPALRPEHHPTRRSTFTAGYASVAPCKSEPSTRCWQCTA